MATQPKSFITEEQYLEIEAKAERKSEYFNGEMFLMAGANEDHNLICMNLYAVLRNDLRDKCRVYGSDMRVRIPATNFYTYPDATIVCGERQWADDARTTLLNPTVVIEVLSDSTEAYDRGDKLLQYWQIPSLREYILVSQKSPRIDQFVRQPDGEFKLRLYHSLDETLEIISVGCSIPVREIYLNTEIYGHST